MSMQTVTAPNSGIPGMATDPPVSEKQRRAMYAAAAGHSTLGIPQSVGKEFVGDEQDDHTRGAGVALRDGDKYLFVKRNGTGDHAGTWAFPGGYAHQGENEEAAAIRELGEELGLWLQGGLPVRIVNDESPDHGFKFTTFVKDVEPFEPKLNEESDEYRWATLDDLPFPLHPGVKKTLEGIAGMGADPVGGSGMDAKRDKPSVDYSPATGQDQNCGSCQHYANNACELVEGPIDPDFWCKLFDKRGLAADHYAFDRASVRSIDADGRLHVELTNISKANVCPYLGREIPRWQELGLQADRIYQLLRDPEELKKAAPTFNNVQLLSEHQPVSATDHQPDLVIGSTGTDAEFSFPYLKNSLVIWSKDAINMIESGGQKELSSAYRYRADMTPGNYQGAEYDGIMRDIVGNHVALVKEGRAGTDVVVGDSKAAVTAQQAERKIPMSTAKLSRTAAFVGGALTTFLLPKLAQDSKLPDLLPALAGVTAKNFTEMKPKIIEGITSAFKDVALAKDANLDDMHSFIDRLDKLKDDDEPAIDEEEGLIPEEKKPRAFDEERMGGLQNFLKGKLSEDDMNSVNAYMAGDDPPAFAGMPVKGAGATDENEEIKPVDQKAMDEAIKAATDTATKKVLDTQRAIREAERFVRPFVGELAIAHDSAEAVHRAAATILGVKNADKVHPDALPALIEAAGSKKAEPVTTVAMDAASIDDFNSRYPGASRIGIM